jgi:hypothetical protein
MQKSCQFILTSGPSTGKKCNTSCEPIEGTYALYCDQHIETLFNDIPVPIPAAEIKPAEVMAIPALPALPTDNWKQPAQPAIPVASDIKPVETSGCPFILGGNDGHGRWLRCQAPAAKVGVWCDAHTPKGCIFKLEKGPRCGFPCEADRFPGRDYCIGHQRKMIKAQAAELGRQMLKREMALVTAIEGQKAPPVPETVQPGASDTKVSAVPAVCPFTLGYFEGEWLYCEAHAVAGGIFCDVHQSKGCIFKLEKGPRMGFPCNENPMLGIDYCPKHQMKNVKRQGKQISCKILDSIPKPAPVSLPASTPVLGIPTVPIPSTGGGLKFVHPIPAPKGGWTAERPAPVAEPLKDCCSYLLQKGPYRGMYCARPHTANSKLCKPHEEIKQAQEAAVKQDLQDEKASKTIPRMSVPNVSMPTIFVPNVPVPSTSIPKIHTPQGPTDKCQHIFTRGMKKGEYCHKPSLRNARLCKIHEKRMRFISTNMTMPPPPVMQPVFSPSSILSKPQPSSSSLPTSSPTVGWELNKMKLCTYIRNKDGKSRCGQPAFHLVMVNEGDFYMCQYCLDHITANYPQRIDTVPLGVRAEPAQGMTFFPFNLTFQLFTVMPGNLIVHMNHDRPKVIGRKGETDAILPLREEDVVQASELFLSFLRPIEPSYGAVDHPAGSVDVQLYEPVDSLFLTEEHNLLVEHSKPNQPRVIGKLVDVDVEPLDKDDLAFAYKNGLEIAAHVRPVPGLLTFIPQIRSTSPSMPALIPPVSQIPFVPGPTPQISRCDEPHVRSLQVTKFDVARGLFLTTERDIIVTQGANSTLAVGKKLSNVVVPIEDSEDIKWIKQHNILLVKFDKKRFD